MVWFFIANANANTISEFPSRLWKITPIEANGLASLEIMPSYILGTMHLPDKEIVELPPHISAVVQSSAALAIEVKLDGPAQKVMAKLSALTGNDTLKDLIGTTAFDQVVSVLQPRGLTPLGLQRLKPWAVALMLNYPPPSLDPILDYSLQLQFKRANKPIYQLETAEEQVQIFDQMTIAEQIGFLRYSLEQLKHFEPYLKAMKSLYIQDDLDGLQALASEQMLDANEPYLKRLFVELIEKRNHKMANRMISYLNQGRHLIAVGALHLTGDQGLLNLLQERGYSVTPVLAAPLDKIVVK